MMKLMLTVFLYDAFAIAVMVYLATVFGKWWIALFAVLFIQRVYLKRELKEDGELKEDEEGEMDE